MVDNKVIPKEFVSIRQIWLNNINRCCEAIANRAKPDVSPEGNWVEIGQRTVVYSVLALNYSLVDYGEAKIKTEIDRYLKEIVNPKIKQSNNWSGNAEVHQKFFEKIIQVLNKYGMLFESQPKGYSNVEMESV